VLKALTLVHSQCNAYGSLFNPRTVTNPPKVQAWIKALAGKAGYEFCNMTVSGSGGIRRIIFTSDIQWEGKEWI